MTGWWWSGRDRWLCRRVGMWLRWGFSLQLSLDCRSCSSGCQEIIWEQPLNGSSTGTRFWVPEMKKQQRKYNRRLKRYTSAKNPQGRQSRICSLELPDAGAAFPSVGEATSLEKGSLQTTSCSS